VCETLKIVALSCQRALKTVALSHTKNPIKHGSFSPRSPTKMAFSCKRDPQKIALVLPAMEANVSNLK